MTPQQIAAATVQRCAECDSHRIAPVVQPDRSIAYQCRDCKTWVEEPSEA
jgi:hypothetical protein